MVDDFFEGALDGCGAIAGIGLAIVAGLLFVQLLFSPIFWGIAAVALLSWLVHRALSPCVPEKKPLPPIRYGPRIALPSPYPTGRTVALSSVRSGSKALPGRSQDPAAVDAERELLVAVSLDFAAHEPSAFYLPEVGRPYRGHAAAKKRIDRAIQNMHLAGRLTLLLVGRAGIGRGTLARITAARIQRLQRDRGTTPGAYYVVPGDRIRSATQLESVLPRLQPHDIVYLEEVHLLAERVGSRVLLEILRSGPDSGRSTRAPPSLSWIASTSAPDRLGDRRTGLRAALRPEVRLRDPSADLIAEILEDQGMEIHPDAAYEIAERAAPYPARALELYAEAREFALAEESHLILPGHVRDALEVMGAEE